MEESFNEEIGFGIQKNNDVEDMNIEEDIDQKIIISNKPKDGFDIMMEKQKKKHMQYQGMILNILYLTIGVLCISLSNRSHIFGLLGIGLLLISVLKDIEEMDHTFIYILIPTLTGIFTAYSINFYDGIIPIVLIILCCISLLLIKYNYFGSYGILNMNLGLLVVQGFLFAYLINFCINTEYDKKKKVINKINNNMVTLNQLI